MAVSQTFCVQREPVGKRITAAIEPADDPGGPGRTAALLTRARPAWHLLEDRLSRRASVIAAWGSGQRRDRLGRQVALAGRLRTELRWVLLSVRRCSSVRRWQQEGAWERMLTALRERERVQLGRDPTPSAAIVDGQSVRASERGGLHGDDGGEKVSGIKRHLRVDTRGTVLVACVGPASVGDRAGAVVLFSRAGDAFSRLRHVWTDQGYRGADFHAWAQEATGITVEVVQGRDGGFRSTWTRVGAPPPAVPLFSVVPRCWGVERTFAWLGRCRRLSKDYGLRVPAHVFGERHLPRYGHAPRATPREIGPLTGFSDAL
ncbi:Transposase DDE domain-containing protein [Streptomyces sp. 1222.2]|nr:Transposase DDE domain-containing protein [Streptomyces sp. 1222.2]